MARPYTMILIGLLTGLIRVSIVCAVDPFEVNKRLGKGVNIGATFDANPPEMGWGIKWEDYFAQEISKAGFDSIRLPVRWNVKALADPPYTVDAAFFKRVDQVVNEALGHGLLVVLDFHQYDDLPKDVAGQKDRFVAIWRQVAEHYRDYPQDKVLFELLNEPQPGITPEVWNDLFREFLTAIRDSNPTRIVVLEPADWGSLRALDQLKMPDDKHIILSFHHYDPIQFTHQGSHLSGAHKWLGTTWTGTPAQKKFVHDQFTKAKNFAEKQHLPVWLGEFGSFHKADMKSRVMWTEFVARTAESYGFSWAYWDFCSPWFGLYDRRTRAWNAELLDALMGNRQGVPVNDRGC